MNNNGQNGQQPALFYDGIMDAISKMIHGNPQGLSIKQIAMSLWPSRNPDTARAALSRAINPENNDINLNSEEVVRTMKITNRPEDVIFCLCDEFGFERPARKSTENFKKDIKQEVRQIYDQIKMLNNKLDVLDWIDK